MVSWPRICFRPNRMMAPLASAIKHESPPCQPCVCKVKSDKSCCERRTKLSSLGISPRHMDCHALTQLKAVGARSEKIESIASMLALERGGATPPRIRESHQEKQQTRVLGIMTEAALVLLALIIFTAVAEPRSRCLLSKYSKKSLAPVIHSFLMLYYKFHEFI